MSGKTNNFLLASILQGLFFALGHLLNPRVNIVFFGSWWIYGMFCGVLKKYSQSIALPIGFHTGFHATCIFQSFIEHTDQRMNGAAAFHFLILGIIIYDSIKHLLKLRKKSLSTFNLFKNIKSLYWQ